MGTIKVLILDDSLVFREVLSRGLNADPSIRVVGKAGDPYEAIRFIEMYNPDVITCDVEMPKMDGIEFIKQLMPQHPLPVIVVSGIGSAVFDAMAAGAVDFINKPNVQSAEHVEAFILELTKKVKDVSRAKIVNKTIVSPVENLQKLARTDKRIIAIGASTGGTEAIHKLLKALPADIPGIVIVQHIPPMFSKMFAERLNNQTAFRAVEAKSGERVEPGKVIVAPGDQHVRLAKLGEGYKVDVFEGPKVSGHCPSVDVLFESVARVAGDQGIGIILTGMGYDGSKGLLAMRRKGARTIGQDEMSSVVYGMPKVAYDVGAVEKQSPLEAIPQLLVKWLNR